MSLNYRNPVYPHDFADPFVLKTGDGYYAYGTAAPGEDGQIFPILHSTDLVHWTRLKGALQPLQNPAAFSYWAPEVAFRDGKYYLYYSASTSNSDEHHRLRVAISSNPAGPFIDQGRELIPQLGFTIDASPFLDPASGRWYLFFASDFESEAPHGTGLSVIELKDDMTSTRGEVAPVIRAQADWQIYQKNRQYKNRLWPNWYCVEGPSVVYHANKYYCFYSGGAWHGDAYGVGFAVADHPMGPWRDPNALIGPTVLKGIPGKVLGPGHNSTVLAPDGQTLMMIYHAWGPDKNARRMCIDPITWSTQGPRVDGPSTDDRVVTGDK
jgi:beta-xylosidase